MIIPRIVVGWGTVGGLVVDKAVILFGVTVDIFLVRKSLYTLVVSLLCCLRMRAKVSDDVRRHNYGCDIEFLVENR